MQRFKIAPVNLCVPVKFFNQAHLKPAKFKKSKIVLRTKNMRPSLCILIIATMLTSCRKDKIKPGETVEIYLLQKEQRVPGKCQIDGSASLLQDTATIKNQDILDYSQTKYQFTLSGPGVEKIKTFRDSHLLRSLLTSM